MGNWLESVNWTRPLAFAALILPLVLIVLSLRAAQAPWRPVGTISIWQKLARTAPPVGSRRRWHIPLERALAIAALCAGILSLAGPELHPPAQARAWRIFVDRSPSMYLPYVSETSAAASGRTRLEEAWERARLWLAEVAPGREHEWFELAEEAAAPLRGGDLPAAWRSAPWPARAEADFGAEDRPGVLWLTDRTPAVEPRSAALFASGGAAVPGPVAMSGGALLSWNGSTLAEEGSQLVPARVAYSGELDPDVLTLFRIWADARGLALAGEGPCLLTLRGTSATHLEPCTAGRDGWQCHELAASAGLARKPGFQIWLQAQTDPRVLVQWRKGEIECALAACLEPSNDPALFAVSWTELFDGALAGHPELVSLAERSSAGPARVVRHQTTPPPTTAGRTPPLAAYLATLAAICAMLGGLVALVKT